MGEGDVHVLNGWAELGLEGIVVLALPPESTEKAAVEEIMFCKSEGFIELFIDIIGCLVLVIVLAFCLRLTPLTTHFLKK